MHDLDLVGPCIQIGSRCTDINPNLLIGSTISRTGAKPLTGTLGGFVRLSEENMGFLTCAHVVGLKKGQTVSQPSHAELPPLHRSPKYFVQLFYYSKTWDLIPDNTLKLHVCM